MAGDTPFPGMIKEVMDVRKYHYRRETVGNQQIYTLARRPAAAVCPWAFEDLD
jgi:hypothetical protein